MPLHVGDLFKPNPPHWGLRGDKYLWDELRKRYAKVALPETLPEFQRLLETAFGDATGESLTFCDEFKVERFSHGGMSSGYVSGEFWRNNGFPLLIERYLLSRAD